MLFNSYIFILAFLPICLTGFYLFKGKWPVVAKVWLIGMSLWFYGYFNFSYLVIMLFSIGVNHLIFRLLTSDNIGKRKPIFIAGVVINLSLLFYFKYFDFFIENCNAILGTQMPLKNILLPLGISFFTFQQVGFLADTYRKEIKQCNFVDYALFVSFFPQLIAGPIVNHDEMLPQFEAVGKNSFDFDKFLRGIYIFILGMAKKVLIADTFGVAVDYAYANLSYGINSTESLLTILFYTLQLYFDFSGYCDMAIGLGNMLGIDIPVNFNSPYKAVNIVDFWKRWHITLSRFFTKNIYIPLGGNRKGSVRLYINLFTVFFLSGLWHGAGWNFILWGCMHGVLYVITRAYERYKKKDRSSKDSNAVSANTDRKAERTEKTKQPFVFGHVIAVILTFTFVNLAWVFFRAANLADAIKLINGVFEGNWALPGREFADAFNLSELWYVLKVLHLTNWGFSQYILMVLFTLFAMVVTFFAPNVHEMADRTKYGTLTAILLAVVLVWCIVSLSGVSTFLYFNF